jgi:hypothetical protein
MLVKIQILFGLGYEYFRCSYLLNGESSYLGAIAISGIMLMLSLEETNMIRFILKLNK